MLTTTLNRIRFHRPCANGWETLLSGLGKTKADDEELPYATILKIHGLDDALWCCRVEPQFNKEWRLFAIWCARQVQHLLADPRSLNALDVAEKFAKGEVTKVALKSAFSAACAAESRAAKAARAAESEAARVTWAAWSWGTARASEYTAARAAARVALAAWDASSAVRVSAGNTTNVPWSTFIAARAAEYAVKASKSSQAYAAAREAQRVKFLEIVG